MRQFAKAVQNQPIDVSEEFGKQENHFFVASKAEEFDRSSASGKIRWKGQALKQRISYHQLTLQLEDYKVWEDTPPGEYEDDQTFPFSIAFVTPRTVRLRVPVRPASIGKRESLMLVGEPGSGDSSWEMNDDGDSTTYASRFGSLVVEHDPLHFEFRDASGGLLTRTNHLSDASDAPGVVNSMPTP